MPEFFAFQRLPGIDLRGVDLVEATLQEAELPGANLDGVRDCDALANGVVLTGASLSGANFVKAALVEADFTGATADGTRFNRANLREARFDRASLRGAQFRGAYLGDASFAGADVTHADFDGAVLAHVTVSAEPPTDDLDCRLFVDGAGDRDALTAQLGELLGLTADGHWLSGRGMGLLADRNDYAHGGDKDDPSADFLSYEHSVEWYFAPGVGVALRAALVGRALQMVRRGGGRAVAACDYEDALP